MPSFMRRRRAVLAMSRFVALLAATILLILVAPWPATAQVCRPSDPACGIPIIVGGEGPPKACVEHVCAQADVNASAQTSSGMPEVDRGQNGTYETIVGSTSGNEAANIT